MPTKTLTFFSLALFPPVFLLQRVLAADVIVVLTDRQLDDKNHVNRCVIRPASGIMRTIEIPVRATGLRIDQTEVPAHSTWFPAMEDQVRRAYSGLEMAPEACTLLSESMSRARSSPWLVDYLMNAFMTTMQYLGLQSEKEVFRGDSLERKPYVADSDYLLNYCLENRCNRLLVGTGPEGKWQERFSRAGVRIVRQQWHGSATLRAQDSILDAVARLSANNICSGLMKKPTRKA